MRNSTIFIIFAATMMLILGFLLIVHPAVSSSEYQKRTSANRQVVERLGLTDICLFTEAGYTRHVTQSDLFSAFRDHPGAREHLPSGSMFGPPPRFEKQIPSRNMEK